MITYSVTRKFIVGVAAIVLVSLFTAKFLRDIDQLRIPLILIAAAGLLFFFVYAICFPTYFGCFIKVVESHTGFDL